MPDNHTTKHFKPRKCRVIIREFKGKPEYCNTNLDKDGRCPFHG